MKVLIVIDMQNDFINGSLGTKEAEEIVSNVVNKIKICDCTTIYTKDTHFDYYESTLEGKKLPIRHCIKDSYGWDINRDVMDAMNSISYHNFENIKYTFGANWDANKELKMILMDADEIELCGLCTDICVVSNALILRAMFPNKKIVVDASCCAGTSVEAHSSAILVMKNCQIDIINE